MNRYLCTGYLKLYEEFGAISVMIRHNAHPQESSSLWEIKQTKIINLNMYAHKAMITQVFFLSWLRSMGNNAYQWDAVYEGKIIKGVILKLFLNKKKGCTFKYLVQD